MAGSGPTAGTVQPTPEDVVSYARRIRQLAAQSSDEPALRVVAEDGAETAFTWAELDRRSDQLAGALARRGLDCGDILAIGIPNSVPAALSVFACWKIGAIPVPLRWDMPDWERGRLLERVQPALALDQSDVPWIDATASLAVPDLPDAVSPHVNGICSSGSTGLPKVILVNRPGVYDPTLAPPLIDNWAAVPHPETILVMGPIYHTNGFATFHRLLAGDRLLIMSRFDAALAVDLIERYRVSTFTATPTMLKRLADVPDIEARDLSSIEWILQGAAPMPDWLMERWVGLVGAERIVTAYGMTEGLGLTALRGDEWLTHRGSVGRPVRETEIRILDEERRPLPPCEIGDIYMRSLMTGGYRYLGGAPSLQGTDDGFQTVGDMGYVDDEGFLYLVDRRVDLIITGGANVYPAEVEAALVEHPDIADVVVIGLRDEEWGRRVHAVIEPRDHAAPPDPATLIAYAKARLAPYKVPKTVEFVDHIPRSAATKVNRQALVDARGG